VDRTQWDVLVGAVPEKRSVAPSLDEFHIKMMDITEENYYLI
jgi:hypothetical protein